ncbi:MAG TPA: phosphoribosylanthranilate isomerase [Terracidiphilus sp.]|jgi:phosphoribosylanthranilate isomerase|nr:phosphoribosylanthranilate isomerase [Terracidiphilus sp.]
MSLWIKICGNTSLDDARLAVEAGADAVGFVFAPSPRRVTMDQVAAITRHLPQAVEQIGVFVDAPLEEIEFAVRACRLTGVQLHSDDAGPELPALLRVRLGPLLRIVRVVHFGPDAAARAAAISLDPSVDAMLVDSRTATAVGGTGVVFDWDLAATTLFQNAKERKFIAAGGLSPANVTEAVATLQPWGVDVVSGVEASPGRKDPEKVREFIAKARAAERR